MYRIEFGDPTGITRLDFKSYTAAHDCFNVLQMAQDIDSVQVWDMDHVDLDGDPDAYIMLEWKAYKGCKGCGAGPDEGCECTKGYSQDGFPS